MPRKSIEVAVEPKVLRWARESIGRSIDEVAKKLKVSENTIINWESGLKKPTLIQLEKLASSIYKRPFASFFLPTPPVELPLPTDFRTLPTDKKLPFSSKTRLAIRRARRLQSLATDLTESFNLKIYKVGTINLPDNPEVISTKVREELETNVQTQFDWKNEYMAFNEWKKTIETRRILVFQLSMPLEETRGFSLTDNKSPTIVLNLRDSINGRIFSLFHEYAHILLNESGICDMEEQDGLPEKEKTIERFCNHFAGAILVPRDVLLEHSLIKNKHITKWSDEILKGLARSFKVSQEVILRRLTILGLASKEFYKRKHEQWLQESKELEWKKQVYKISQPEKCVRENGIPLISLVIEAHKEGKITYSDIADYLGIRIKHLPKIEQLIGEKV